jgi:uncharacterized 2Fe-2S/4Fe-4S cluster protein (DUF4445 family)
MKRKLTIREGRSIETIDIEEGESISAALVVRRSSRMPNQSLDYPCGGKGLCGKCRIRLLSGRLSSACEAETRHLSAAELAAGWRLACLARIEGEAEIELPVLGDASIVVAGPDAHVVPDPPIRVLSVTLSGPSLADQTDDETRLLNALATEHSTKQEETLSPGTAPALSRVALDALPGLVRNLRKTDAQESAAAVRAVCSGREVLGVVSGRHGARVLGAGVDLGTTTVVVRLVDLATGEHLGSRSELNAQREFGADVISRIAFASEGTKGLETLKDRITFQIAAMLADLVASAGMDPDDLVSIAVAGNTTMLHLLAGVPPDAIARAPFAPAFLRARTESARSMGLVAHPGCAAILLPGVSGYVGADIVAGIMATGLHEREGLSLYLDLGTNGEIALGGRDGILCCATAAGPAFEGAGIEKGTGGIWGAIDSVWLDDGAIRFGTIGGQAATGICGSGLIDAIAALLDATIVDETGRMMDANESRTLGPKVSSIVQEGAHGPLVYLDAGRNIYLSQADIRAAQLAKAAIAAGIDTLLRVAGIGLHEVAGLYLAGGFGSLLDPHSAARIGLLPSEMAERAVAVGNASASGAVLACLSRRSLADCDRVRSICSYVELSSRTDFNEAYVERMMFPEKI